MDPVLTFHPIKLSEAPVKFKYVIVYTTTTDSVAPTNYSDQGVITVTDSTPFAIKLGMPWRGLLNLSHTTFPSGNRYLWPAVKLYIYLDQAFMPTSLHPDSFNVLVTLDTADWTTQGMMLTYNVGNAILK